MRKKTQELKKGSIVYINPATTTDPYNLRGNKCKVLKVDKVRDEVKVKCGKKTGIYEADTLMSAKEFKRQFI